LAGASCGVPVYSQAAADTYFVYHGAMTRMVDYK